MSPTTFIFYKFDVCIPNQYKLGTPSQGRGSLPIVLEYFLSWLTNFVLFNDVYVVVRG